MGDWQDYNLYCDAVDVLKNIHELVEEYRTSEDHTLARAHIALFKIDELMMELPAFTQDSASLRRDQE